MYYASCGRSLCLYSDRIVEASQCSHERIPLRCSIWKPMANEALSQWNAYIIYYVIVIHIILFWPFSVACSSKRSNCFLNNNYTSSPPPLDHLVFVFSLFFVLSHLDHTLLGLPLDPRRYCHCVPLLGNHPLALLPRHYLLLNSLETNILPRAHLHYLRPLPSPLICS